MSMTRADLAKEVLQELAILSSDEDPTAEDSEKVLAKYDREWARLYKLGTIWTQDPIDDEVSEALVVHIACCCAKAFGRALAPGEKEEAERQLRAAASTPYSAKPAEIEYF